MAYDEKAHGEPACDPPFREGRSLGEWKSRELARQPSGRTQRAIGEAWFRDAPTGLAAATEYHLG